MARQSETHENVREVVRTGYAEVARGRAGSCCGGKSPERLAETVGYAATELEQLPQGANMGLSCGNPTALASLLAGEVVIDLGSGGGFDAFVAGPRVGATGRVIGVDMTSGDGGQGPRANPRHLPREQRARATWSFDWERSSTSRLADSSVGRGDFQLCDQPLTGQAAGLARDRPGTHARRTRGRLRPGVARSRCRREDPRAGGGDGRLRGRRRQRRAETERAATEAGLVDFVEPAQTRLRRSDDGVERSAVEARSSTTCREGRRPGGLRLQRRISPRARPG